MAYKVCLLDSDPAYQRALMEYLNLRATIPIQLYVFSNPAVYAAFREREKPELILVGDCYAELEDAAEGLPRFWCSRQTANISGGRSIFFGTRVWNIWLKRCFR